jgi:predicted signal transduction protein with EAL and GGDEF domain
VKWQFNITTKLLGYLLMAGVVPLILLGATAFDISKRIVIEQAEAENTRLVAIHIFSRGVERFQVGETLDVSQITKPLIGELLEGVIELAKAFHREVIAEGVETIEHGTRLLQMGCDLAQGYGIAPPMPATDFPGWAAAWRPDAAWLRHDDQP